MENIESAEKEYNKFQWFLFVVIIPTLFAVTLLLVVLTIAGVNVIDKAKDIGGKIPGISKLVKEDEPKNGKTTTPTDINGLKAQIAKKEKQMAEMEKELSEKDQETESLKIEIEKLKSELKAASETKEAQAKTDEELTKMYETMAPKSAASIIPNMADQDAKKVLTLLKPDIRAAILEKMDPKDAAKYTKLLTEQ